MRKRILRIAMAVLMLAVMVPSALAATYEEINQDQVFLKQEQRGTCTLAATAMMLRRAALLNGEENWAQITEASCRQAFWIAGCGLPYNFSYGEMTVSHDTLPGGEANKDILIDLLAEHPEGIMLHAACVPHGILLTEYKDGQFYCADPSEYVGEGIIPIEEAWGTRVENSNAYWYVTSEVAEVEPDLPDLVPEEVTVESSVADLLAPLDQPEEDTCLIGQALLAGSEDN